MKAPFLLRCAAALIDYILVVSVPVLGLLLSRFAGNDGAGLFNSTANTVGWLIAVLFYISNVILLPMYAGQSAGKMITGLRIVDVNGGRVEPPKMALRQTFGIFLTALTAGLGFFLSVFGRNGRALHDLVGGSVVIYAEKRQR